MPSSFTENVLLDNSERKIVDAAITPNLKLERYKMKKARQRKIAKNMPDKRREYITGPTDGHLLLSDSDTSKGMAKTAISACAILATDVAEDSSDNAPHANNLAPKRPFTPSRADIDGHKVKVIKKKRAIRLLKRHVDRYKTSVMAKALARIRAKEEMSLVKYPFTIRGIENILAEVYDYINTSHKGRISYREFGKHCRLVTDEDDDPDSRLQLHPPTPFPPEVLQLSRIDTLWHHMYCVAVPALFVVDETTGDYVQKSLPPGSDHPIWLLRKLTEQARDVGILPSKSHHALEILKILRNRFPPLLDSEINKSSRGVKRSRDGGNSLNPIDLNVDVNPSSGKDTTTSTFLEGLIPRYEESESTIDLSAEPLVLGEKMKALRAERERKRKEGVWNGRIERVAFADCLYSHACQILRQINARAPLVLGKDRAAQLTQQKTKCVLTFSDVVSKVFEGRSPSECLELMIDIVKVTRSSELPGQPAFLRWQDPKTGLNGVPLSTTASVWIDTVSYSRVRKLLTGENRPMELQLAPKPTQAAVIPSQNKHLEALNPSDADDCHERVPKSRKSLLVAANQSQEASASCDSPKYRTLKRPATDTLLATRKRIALDGTRTNFDVDVEKKSNVVNGQNVGVRATEKKGLRINPHHILCDADYSGGIVLQPSTNFPRGLRRLFYSLNHGRRI